MISSVISSVARLPLAPARLAGRMAGSLLSGLRGAVAGDGRQPPPPSRTKSSRPRSKAQPKRAASRTRAKAQPKRAGSRTGAKAQPKRAGSRTKAQPRRARRRKPLDDGTITRKVESTIFEGVDADTDKVDVSVAQGVVSLRGEVPTPDLISELETRAGRLSEVRRVENLLGLAKLSAPSPTATSAPQSEATGETSEKQPTAGSALRPSSFAAAGQEGRPAPAGSTHDAADAADEGAAGDQSAEREGPDPAELDKDHASQPSDPGLGDLKRS